MNPLLTIEEVAQILQVSKRQLEYMIQGGDAPAMIRIGRLRRFELAAIQEWINQQKNIPLGNQPAREGYAP
jgi:excisionase family DNA binding protein